MGERGARKREGRVWGHAPAKIRLSRCGPPEYAVARVAREVQKRRPETGATRPSREGISRPPPPRNHKSGYRLVSGPKRPPRHKWTFLTGGHNPGPGTTTKNVSPGTTSLPVQRLSRYNVSPGTAVSQAKHVPQSERAQNRPSDRSRLLSTCRRNIGRAEGR